LSKSIKISSISIVIPALNEEMAIGQVVSSIPKEKLEEMGLSVQILVIDNGSDDRTTEFARMSGAEVIAEPRRGYGQAYKMGFAHATGDLIATLDADLSYPTDVIPKLVKIFIEEGLEFITTNRFGNRDPNSISSRNIIGNSILNLTTRLLYGINLRDSQSGMWLFRRGLLDRIACRSNNMSFSQELKLDTIYWINCRWKEVPIEYYPRVGETKLLGWNHGFRNQVDLIRKRFYR